MFENELTCEINSLLGGLLNYEQAVGLTSTHKYNQISSDPPHASFELVGRTEELVSENVGGTALGPSPDEVFRIEEQDLVDSEHFTKLERINQLLREAAKLQKEVFG